jgi:K+-transporting ATPase A subunit
MALPGADTSDWQARVATRPVHDRVLVLLALGGVLLGVIVIVGGLIYFPMLILGPIGERIIG